MRELRIDSFADVIVAADAERLLVVDQQRFLIRRVRRVAGRAVAGLERCVDVLVLLHLVLLVAVAGEAEFGLFGSQLERLPLFLRLVTARAVGESCMNDVAEIALFRSGVRGVAIRAVFGDRDAGVLRHRA